MTKLPKVIVSALIKRDDKYLLVKEVLESGKEYWIIPGGTVEFGEELAAALKREIKEETNLDIKIEKFLNFHEAIFPEYNYHTVIFFYQASLLNENIALDDKIIEARYFSQEEIKSLNLVSSARWLLAKITENRPYDPCGHTKIAVSDYKKSYPFYKDIFEWLDYKQVSNKNDHAGWVSPEGYAILIAQAKITDYQYRFGAPGLYHLCLKARSVEMVNQVYQSLLKKKVFIFNAPQKRPEFTDKYYAMCFADPDGIKLEVAYY